MDIMVLGTKFNVSAYPEDLQINTVLVEGSVSIFDSELGYYATTASLLEPGDKAAWDKVHSDINVEKVDTSIYTGWISGKLVIKEMPFYNIVKKLERHYNISIDNNYEYLNDQVFTATFDVETIEQVLKIFSHETPFEYEIQNQKVIINRPINVSQ